MASDLSDKSRLLFGAGFVFGVGFTMVVMGLVTVAVARRTGRQLVTGEVLVTLVAGVFFAAVVGLSLYFLAFPENRVEIPIEGLRTRRPDDAEDAPRE